MVESGVCRSHNSVTGRGESAGVPERFRNDRSAFHPSSMPVVPEFDPGDGCDVVIFSLFIHSDCYGGALSIWVFYGGLILNFSVICWFF